MTQFQDIRPGSVAIPTRQVVNKAGEISSTVEDVSSWPVENGLNIKDGKLALSTSSSTTVTNAENLYPALWNNSPTAWKSGSDLVVPPQGVKSGVSEWIDFTNVDYGSDFGNSTWDYLQYRIAGNTIDVRGLLQCGTTFTPGASLVINALPENFTITDNFDYKTILGTVNYIKSGNNYGNGGYCQHFTNLILFNTSGSAGGDTSAFVNTNNPFTWDASCGISFELRGIAVEELNNQTPLIYLFDNVTSSSIGLPEIGAEQPGLPTLDQIAEGNRNLIINGAKEFNQRGATSGPIGTSSDYLYSDRFAVEKSGSATVVNGFYTAGDTPNDNIFPFKNRYTVQSTTGGAGLYISTRIEAKEIKPYIGKKMVFSLYVKSNSGNPDLKMKVYSSTSLDVWSNDLSTAPDTEEFSKTIQTTSEWVRQQLVFEVPQNCENGIALSLQSTNDTSLALNDGISETGWKLEQGTEATKFTRAGVTYAGELALCQRYYEKSIALQETPGTVQANSLIYGQAFSFTSSHAIVCQPFKVVKRSNPTIVIYSRQGEAGKCTQDSNANDHGTASVGNSDDKMLYTISTSATITDAVRFYWTADSEL